jgi:V8-like Glu-specific endopeptidase
MAKKHGSEDTAGSTAEALYPPHVEDIEGVSASDELTTDPDEYGRLLESQCGATDDSQNVEQYDGSLGVTIGFVAANQSRAGQVQWNANLGAVYTTAGNVSGVRWGSGTLISQDLFLTAGHLFDQTGGGWNRPLQNGTSNVISPQEIATNMHVNFNYQFDPAGNLRPEQSFAVLQLVEYRIGGVDFAVVRLAGNPGTTFGFSQISPADASVGDIAAVIGHPAGVPKRIEAGPVTGLTAAQILYNDIDTLGGNSGSGVLRAPDGALIGVHTNGGCTTSGTGANFGAPISAVISNSASVRGILAGGGTSIKFLDDGGGTVNKFRDDGGTPTKFRDDGGGTVNKFRDDGGTPNKFRDDGGTPNKFLDDGGGTVNKFRDDGGGTVNKFLDDGGGTVNKFRDDGGTPNKFLDDGGTMKIIDDGAGHGQPPGPQPFILATPHHATEWAGGPLPAYGEEGAVGDFEDALQEVAVLIDHAAAALDELVRKYGELLEAYQQLAGGQQ